MAMLQPYFMQADDTDPAIEYSAQDYRLALVDSVYSREGVLAPELGQLRVSQRGAGANMSVDVAAGFVVIEGDDVSDQGKYVMQSTATENRAVFSDGTAISAPGAGSRTHRMVAQVKDKLHNGFWTGYTWEFDLLQDDGSGTPDVPDSAVHLAYVGIAAGQASITDGDIDTVSDVPRASVGTPAREGALATTYQSYAANDSTRPLRWSVNPDGWVQLSGFLRWIGTDGFVVPAYQQTQMSAADMFDDPSVRPPGIRDFPGVSSHGPVHYAVYPSGIIYYRFQYEITNATNDSWWSFDGCFYRL